MASNLNPLVTGNTRVFIVEGRARPDHAPSYESGMRMAGVSQGFGDIERIEVPHPSKYGAYLEVGQVRGSTERVTTTLEGRYALNLKSTLLRLARAGCSVDVQLHMGNCQDPSLFDDFTKALIVEDAQITSYETEDLGALSSDDQAVVNESVEISAKEVYEVVQLSFAARAASTVTNEIVDVVVCGSSSCGDCDEENDGCQKVYAVSLAAGGSPSTPPDLLYSLDGGTTWYAHDVDTLTSSQDPTAIGCIDKYAVVTSNDAGSINYCLLSELDGSTDPSFTEVTTGIVASGEPNDISVASNTGFLVGDAGYIYKCTDPTAGVTALDEGVAVSDNLNAVHALSDTFAVAVGNAGAVVKTEDGAVWSEVTPRPVGVTVNLTSVAVKSEKEWFIGTSDGKLHYTIDGGSTWTEKSFSGSGAGVVRDIVMATNSVMYLSHDTATPAGRILRSYNGGQSWIVLPEGVGSLPANDRLTALAACSDDANFVVGVGLADDAADGIIIVGQ